MNEDNSIVIDRADYDRMVIQNYEYRQLMTKIKRLTRRRPGDYVDIDCSELAKYMMQAVPGYQKYVEILEEIPWMNNDEKGEENS